MIDNVRIVSLEQIYDDGRPPKIWSIGDEYNKNSVKILFYANCG